MDQQVESTNQATTNYMVLPWWSSGTESVCQGRGHGFDPWSRKIPPAAGQLSPCGTLEPMLHNKRSRHSDKSVHHSCREAPHSLQLEKGPCEVTRPSEGKNKHIKKKTYMNQS